MPNWCNNDITIRGSKETIGQLWEDAQEKNGLLEAMAPIGEWDYGTAVDTWGTKWDVSLEGLEYADHGDGTAEIAGWADSAWSPPVEAFQSFCDSMDGVYAELVYFEPGVAFTGRWDSEGTNDHYEIDTEAEDLGIPEELNEHFDIASWYELDEEMMDD